MHVTLSERLSEGNPNRADVIYCSRLLYVDTLIDQVNDERLKLHVLLPMRCVFDLESASRVEFGICPFSGFRLRIERVELKTEEGLFAGLPSCFQIKSFDYSDFNHFVIEGYFFEIHHSCQLFLGKWLPHAHTEHELAKA